MCFYIHRLSLWMTSRVWISIFRLFLNFHTCSWKITLHLAIYKEEWQSKWCSRILSYHRSKHVCVNGVLHHFQNCHICLHIDLQCILYIADVIKVIFIAKLWIICSWLVKLLVNCLRSSYLVLFLFRKIILSYTVMNLS